MKRWELEIATTKCVVMRIGIKNHVNSYFINDFELPIQTSFEDLGITFNDNMSFNTHINTIFTKAYLIINRLFKFFMTNDYIYLLKAHLSCVRPIVESDTTVWNPDNFICNSNNIENIQIYFTKIVFYRCNLTKRSYEDRIIVLNIKTLFHRMLLADLILTYKILNGLVDVDATDIFDIYSNKCRGPKVKIRKKMCRTNTHLNYFGNRICSSWMGYLLQLHLVKP